MKLYSDRDAKNTIDFISDTHFEFYSEIDYEKKVKDIFYNQCSDILFIAGDFCQADRWKEVDLNIIFNKYKKVYYLFGNHEFYNSNIFLIQSHIDNMQNAYPNVKFIPDNYHCTELNAIFFTNWHTPQHTDLQRIADSRFIIDYNEHVKEMRARDDKFLAKLLMLDIQPKYAVTHYLPFFESISLKYMGSPLNKFFLSDRESILHILKPKIVVHGHTHETQHYIKNFEDSDVTIAVWCNPIGYPNERKLYGAETGDYVRHFYNTSD
jgi:predicted phosphodiesterase